MKTINLLDLPKLDLNQREDYESAINMFLAVTLSISMLRVENNPTSTNICQLLVFTIVLHNVKQQMLDDFDKGHKKKH